MVRRPLALLILLAAGSLYALSFSLAVDKLIESGTPRVQTEEGFSIETDAVTRRVQIVRARADKAAHRVAELALLERQKREAAAAEQDAAAKARLEAEAERLRARAAKVQGRLDRDLAELEVLRRYIIWMLEVRPREKVARDIRDRVSRINQVLIVTEDVWRRAWNAGGVPRYVCKEGFICFPEEGAAPSATRAVVRESEEHSTLAAAATRAGVALTAQVRASGKLRLPEVPLPKSIAQGLRKEAPTRGLFATVFGGGMILREDGGSPGSTRREELPGFDPDLIDRTGRRIQDHFK